MAGWSPTCARARTTRIASICGPTTCRAARHRLLVDSRVLAGADRALSAEEEARRERQRTSAYSGIVEYSFAPDSRHLLIPLNGDLYVYDLGAQARQRGAPAHDHGGLRDRRAFLAALALREFRARPESLHRRPGEFGRTRDHARRRRPVSFGMAEFIAQEEMDRDTGYWWSPDERHIVLARVDESPVAEVERFEIQADSARIVRQRYPATGTANARVELFVADLATDKLTAARPRCRARHLSTARRLVSGQPRHRRAAAEPRPENARAAAVRCAHRPRPSAAHRAQRALGAAASRAHLPASDLAIHLGVVARRLPAPLSLWKRRQARAPAHERRVHGRWRWRTEPAIRAVDERARRVYFTANLPSPVERQLFWVSLDEPARVRSA